jgi:lysophospholipase L1-like esterase
MKSPLLLGLVLAASPLFAQDAQPLLQSGDRVVFVGNTFVERARLHGHLETSLQLAAGPEVKGLVFRNLGWSGDSVFGDSRSYFGPPAEGRERLARNLGEIKPTVALLWYGAETALSVDQGWTDEAADAAAKVSGSGLEASKALFLQGYQALIDALRSAAEGQLRELVIVSPPPFENLGAPLPDQSANNRNLAAVRDGLRGLAEKNGARFVDLFSALGGDAFDGEVASPALTEDGVNHGEAGHALVARELAKGLGYPEGPIAGKDNESLAALRAAVVEKDRLFFHRWRPANETYLFLFRKHEQGQNAKEIPMFDPLIAEQEKKVEKARAVVFAGMPKN